MFAPSIQVEYVSFFEPTEGVWREETVKVSTVVESGQGQECTDEDLEAFCRHSLL